MKQTASDRLLLGLLNGAKKVVTKKQELDSINVFPVADGDTGSNLSALMQVILNQVSIKSFSAKEGLEQFSNAAMIGARGNSGMIFAQFFYGLSNNFDEQLPLEQAFVYATKGAFKKSFQAVLEPKEGTILSVMRVWSEQLVIKIESGESLMEALISAKMYANKALEQTQFQMSILKKNKVVDAGAKGFYYFISGLTEYICYGTTYQEMNNMEGQRETIEEHFLAEAPLKRYCSEFLVKEIIPKFEYFKKDISKFGDSLVIIGDQKKVKIHIHTNEPADLMTYLVENGKVVYQKVDDMLLQYQVGQDRKEEIAIVTDSTADFPKDFNLKHQIHVLPMNILLDEVFYLDKLTITPSNLKSKLNIATSMSTAQPSIQTVDALISFLENKYKHIIIITVSAKLSGTYQLIMNRVKEKNLSSDKVRVIDSKLNSIGQGLLVKQAFELIEKHEPFEEIIRQILLLRKRIFIYVAVSDLTPMIQSGRIPQFIGNIARKLSIHPIISLNREGNGILFGASLSQNKSIKRINKKLKKFAKKNQLDEVYITHVFNEESAHNWKNQLIDQEVSVNAIVDSSSVIAINAGQSSLAIAGILKEEMQ